MLELSRFDFVLLRLQTRRLKCESRLDRSRIAPTSLFRPSERFSSHFVADHLSLHTSSSAAETGSWRIAQLQTSLGLFGCCVNTGRAATR